MLCITGKERTGAYKQGGRYIFEEWHWFLHWDTFYGYTTCKGVERLYEECFEWLGHDFHLGGPLGEEEFCRRMKNEVKILI
jgi:hypothetical protein